MIGSTYSRFKTEDCAECKLPFEDVMPCDFCEKHHACMECFENWRECPDCGRIGSKEHFDGMSCKGCSNDND